MDDDLNGLRADFLSSPQGPLRKYGPKTFLISNLRQQRKQNLWISPSDFQTGGIFGSDPALFKTLHGESDHRSG